MAAAGPLAKHTSAKLPRKTVRYIQLTSKHLRAISVNRITKTETKTAAVPCAFTFVMRCIIFVLPKLPVPFVRAVHRLAQLNKNMAKVNNNALFRWPR